MRGKSGFENVTLVTTHVPRELPSEFANVTPDVCDVSKSTGNPWATAVVTDVPARKVKIELKREKLP
jgi:hypothetical protein